MALDLEVVELVRTRLGPLYDELVQVMLDVGQAPMFVFGDDRPRVVAVRDRAAEVIRRWELEQPELVGGLVERLPAVFQLPDSAQSLLECVPSTDYFSIPDSLFDRPSDESRVVAAAPTLRGRSDDDGLLDVGDFDARPQGLFVDGLSLQYHQFLRRGFSSNVHYDLVAAILKAASHNGVVGRIAFDDRRVRFKDEHEEVIERDYWYGPPLRDGFLDDPYAVGETIHGDREGGSSIRNPYVALSARWTRDAHLKTVEIEELVPVPAEGWALARYLHAIRDTRQQRFIHCDGAVKAYAADTYPRTAADFPYRARSDRYRKVFRLDGDIPTDEWADIVPMWFRGNLLILEYLNELGAERPQT